MRNEISIREIIRYIYFELGYIVVVTIYLITLNGLNKELNNFDNFIEILSYRDFLAVKYFIGAILLLFIGAWRIWKRIEHMRSEQYSVLEIFLDMAIIIIIAILLILIFNFIQVPILKAVFALASLGVAIVFSATN